MTKVHMWDIEHEMKIPSWETNKTNGYKAAACGYQRLKVTINKKEVTCKLCKKALKASQ